MPYTTNLDQGRALYKRLGGIGSVRNQVMERFPLLLCVRQHCRSAPTSSDVRIAIPPGLQRARQSASLHLVGLR